MHLSVNNALVTVSRKQVLVLSLMLIFIVSGVIVSGATSAQAETLQVGRKCPAINVAPTHGRPTQSTGRNPEPTHGRPTQSNGRNPERQALIPKFGTITAIDGGYQIQISNYDPKFKWTAIDCLGGRANISRTGLIEVTGLTNGDVSSVTVKTERSRYPDGIATSEQITAAPTLYSLLISLLLVITWLGWRNRRKRLVNA